MIQSRPPHAAPIDSAPIAPTFALRVVLRNTDEKHCSGETDEDHECETCEAVCVDESRCDETACTKLCDSDSDEDIDACIKCEDDCIAQIHVDHAHLEL